MGRVAMFSKRFSYFRKLMCEELNNEDFNAALFVLVIIALLVGFFDLLEWIFGSVN